MRQDIAVFVLLWLALQIPLGSFIGDCIKFGAGGLREVRLSRR